MSRNGRPHRHRVCAARPRFERGPPGSEPGWYQFHHLASVWTERLELPTPGFRRRCARRCATSRWVLTADSNPHWQGSRPCASAGVGLREPAGTDGRIRTDTGGGLSAVPLPELGYVSRNGLWPVDSGPWWRGRESNPPGRDYEPPLITRSPARCLRLGAPCHSHSGVYTVVYMVTRTQIYLTDEQRARLGERAKSSGRPVSQLVRDAIDAMLAADDDLDATFGSAPGIGSRVPSRDEWERGGAAPR